ncbi:MAG: hypothetical protein CMQ17_07980 [Gammaproteobacteria bacterium]|nr:hypothetical protein [Gammaproteobacteria bacterium]
MNEPIAEKHRIRSIDTLRGIALLGILLLNIIAFSRPLAEYFDPSVFETQSGLNLFVALTVDVWFEGAFRAIFSMLFGAGVLIFFSKSNSDEETIRALYYRRTWLLIGFGLFNSYILLWVGDILYVYGMAGLTLYFFRGYSPLRLAVFAGAIFFLLGILHTGTHFGTRALYTEFQEVESLSDGEEISEAQANAVDNWDAYLQQQLATPEQMQAEIKIRRQGYIDNFIFSAQINIIFQTILFLVNTFWDAAAMMLLGMVLMKWNIFDASRSLRFYSKMLIAGFSIGLFVNIWEVMMYVNSGFEPYWSQPARPTYDIGRLAMAFGYIGLTMIVCKLGVFARIVGALACVGQLALTNYLMQSVICNFIFMGFGFGLFGQLERLEIYYVVPGVWLFQLIFSVYWLQHYRFGPAEWLWRSLTYWKRQPLRRIVP